MMIAHSVKRLSRNCIPVLQGGRSFGSSTVLYKEDKVIRTEDLISTVSETHDLSRAKAKRIVDTILDSIVDVSISSKVARLQYGIIAYFNIVFLLS